MSEAPAAAGRAARRRGLWSADYSRTTGQAIVTARAASVLRPAGLREFIYSGSGGAMVLAWLRAAGALWRATLRGELHVLYLVCSRSTGGFLRDLPAYLARLAGVRVVVHTHGSDIVDLLRRPGVGAIARLLLRRCEIILPSRHLDAPLKDLGMGTLHVCENFVQGPAASEGAHDRDDAPGTPPGPLRVFWNSNVMASKGFFLVADAVSRLQNGPRPVTLAAIGAPLADEQMPLAQCSARLDALIQQPWFTYHGPVDRAGSTRLLDRCDVVCLPSTYSSECQPLALLEAMCAAKALVVADTPALRATVGTYPCEFAEPLDAPSVAAAILRAAQDAPDARRAAQSDARQRFSAQRFDQQFADIVELPGAGAHAAAPATRPHPEDNPQNRT